MVNGRWDGWRGQYGLYGISGKHFPDSPLWSSIHEVHLEQEDRDRLFGGVPAIAALPPAAAN